MSVVSFGLSDGELPDYISLMVELLTSGFSAILSSACPVEYGIYSSGVYCLPPEMLALLNAQLIQLGRSLFHWGILYSSD